MKKIVLSILCVVQCFSLRGDLLGRDTALSSYEAIKNLIDTMPVPNLNTLIPQISAFARKYNLQNHDMWISFLTRSLELSGVFKEIYQCGAKNAFNTLAKDYKASIDEKIAKLDRDIKAIQGSTFTSREKRFPLELYRAFIARLKNEIEKFKF